MKYNLLRPCFDGHFSLVPTDSFKLGQHCVRLPKDITFTYTDLEKEIDIYLCLKFGSINVNI